MYIFKHWLHVFMQFVINKQFVFQRIQIAPALVTDLRKFVSLEKFDHPYLYQITLVIMRWPIYKDNHPSYHLW